MKKIIYALLLVICVGVVCAEGITSILEQFEPVYLCAGRYELEAIYIAKGNVLCYTFFRLLGGCD